MALSLHTKSFRHPLPGFIHLRRARDSDTILGQWKSKNLWNSWPKKNWNGGSNSILAGFAKRINRCVLHRGNGKSNINQQEKSFWRKCIRKLQRYYLMRAKTNSRFSHISHQAHKKTIKRSHVHNTHRQSHTVCRLGWSRLRFCQILIKMWRRRLRERKVGMNQNLNYWSL